MRNSELSGSDRKEVQATGAATIVFEDLEEAALRGAEAGAKLREALLRIKSNRVKKNRGGRIC